MNIYNDELAKRFATLQQQIDANPKIGITQRQGGLFVCHFWYRDGYEQIGNERFFDTDEWIWNPSNESIRAELKRLCDIGDWDNANRFFIRYAFAPLTKAERDLIIEFAAIDTQCEDHIYLDVRGCIALADEIMGKSTTHGKIHMQNENDDFSKFIKLMHRYQDANANPVREFIGPHWEKSFPNEKDMWGIDEGSLCGRLIVRLCSEMDAFIAKMNLDNGGAHPDTARELRTAIVRECGVIYYG